MHLICTEMSNSKIATSLSRSVDLHSLQTREMLALSLFLVQIRSHKKQSALLSSLIPYSDREQFRLRNFKLRSSLRVSNLKQLFVSFALYLTTLLENLTWLSRDDQRVWLPDSFSPKKKKEIVQKWSSIEELLSLPNYLELLGPFYENMPGNKPSG